ncbi:MAG: IPT/TIG domain-containing protein [Candidatus Sericytochromatia bacterium]
MRPLFSRGCLAVLASSSLLACQSPATQSPASVAPRQQALASSQQSAAPPLYKPSAGEMAWGAQVLSGSTHDSLKVSLSKGFRTQAFDSSVIQFMRVSVTGPGIASPIVSEAIDVSGGGPYTVNLTKVPKGANRVVTAQFYDAADNPILLAVSKAVYTSSSTGTSVNLELRRRYLPLGEVIEGLLVSNPALAESLDAAALQLEIDALLYGGGPAVQPFAVDPFLVRVDLIQNDLIANAGSIGDYAGGGFVKTTADLSYTVNGLVGDDTVTVRVGDPTSQATESVGSNLSISNIAPGTWPIAFSVDGGITYTNALPNSTGTVFALGDTVNGGTITMTYNTPEIDSLSVSQGPRGSQVTLTGHYFHTDKDNNSVTFDNGMGGTFAGTLVSASATELVVSIPTSAASGTYSVTATVGTETSDPAPSPFEVLTVFHVKTDGDPAANGTDWSQATTLQNALSKAADGDEIWLQSGTYLPSSTGDREESFLILENIAIYGGFTGTETSFSQRNPAQNPTVLSGDLNGDDMLSSPPLASELLPNHPQRDDNSYHVVTVESAPTGPPVYLDGLIIEGGNANGTTEQVEVKYPPDCDPLIEYGETGYCEYVGTFTNPLGRGGGIVNGGSELSLQQVIVRHNSASERGGGIYSAPLSSGGFGAGRLDLLGSSYATPPTGEIPRTVISHNYTAGLGGGLYSGDRAFLNNALFENNTAAESGGGLYLDSGSENGFPMEGANTLIDVVVRANTAGLDGGGVFSNQVRLEMYRSVFAQNTASQYGGGIHYAGEGVTDISAFSWVFSENTAAKGGGMYVSSLNTFASSPLEVEMATFFGNTATAGDTGGHAIYLTGTRSLNLVNSLFFDNTLARGSNDLIFNLKNSLTNAAEDSVVFDDGSLSGTKLGNQGNVLFETDPLFSNAAQPAGSDNLWAVGPEGLQPASNSPALAVGEFTLNRSDVMGTTRPGFPTIGAYEALEP